MILFSIAVVLALVAVARASLWWAGGYVLLNIFATLVIAYTYCAKCLCRPHHCSHVLVGKVADFLPKRAPGPYTAGDYAGMLIASGIVFLYPLPWLVHQPAWLVAFFAIGGLGAAEIFLAVCPKCVNGRCPAMGWTRKVRKTTPPGDDQSA
jgi:hypothetical protein